MDDAESHHDVDAATVLPPQRGNMCVANRSDRLYTRQPASAGGPFAASQGLNRAAELAETRGLRAGARRKAVTR